MRHLSFSSQNIIPSLWKNTVILFILKRGDPSGPNINHQPYKRSSAAFGERICCRNCLCSGSISLSHCEFYLSSASRPSQPLPAGVSQDSILLTDDLSAYFTICSLSYPATYLTTTKTDQDHLVFSASIASGSFNHIYYNLPKICLPILFKHPLFSVNEFCFNYFSFYEVTATIEISPKISLFVGLPFVTQRDSCPERKVHFLFHTCFWHPITFGFYTKFKSARHLNTQVTCGAWSPLLLFLDFDELKRALGWLMIPPWTPNSRP